MEMTGLQVFRPGYGFLPLAEGEKITLANGDTLRVIVTTKYSGLAQTLTLYGAVGTRVPGPYVVGFDEALVGESTDEGHLKCPATTTTPTTPNATGFVDIPIVVNYDAALAPFVGYQDMLPPGKDYDLYVKIKEHPSIRDELDDIIDLSTEGAGGTPPAPSLFEMIGPLLVIGLMAAMVGMMAPMMQGEES